MLRFKTIRFKNFLATGNVFTEIPLDQNNTTLIVGENGTGKSTILDAITFSLFGKAFRNINKPQLLNSQNGKQGLVEIEFDTNGKTYKVVRGLKPNVFEIHVNGILLNQEASRDYQAILEKSILGMNYKSFTQIVILGSASFTPFMQLTAADRRAVIEDLLDIQVFSIMNILAKTKLGTNKEDYARNALELKSANEKKSLIGKTLADLRSNVDEKVATLTERRKKYELANEDLNHDIAEHKAILLVYEEQTAPLASLRNRHKELIAINSKVESTLARHNKDIYFYLHNDTCPTCTQAIETNFKAGVVNDREAKVKTISGGLAQMSTAIDNVVAQISDLTDILLKSQDVNSRLIGAIEKVKSNTKSITEIDFDIEKMSSSDTILLDNMINLEETDREINRLESEKARFLTDRQYLEVAINLLKDGGIKTKIIKKYLPIINKWINKYLSAMGFFVDFNINESFEETIKSRFRDEFSYNNFSEGEKGRIDLAILFTWRYIAKMKNSVHTNLLILDEIFDGSLDAGGTDEFIKIMQSLTADTNTIVISHKTDAMLDKFQKVYTFTKQKNFSVLLDSEAT